MRHFGFHQGTKLRTVYLLIKVKYTNKHK